MCECDQSSMVSQSYNPSCLWIFFGYSHTHCSLRFAAPLGLLKFCFDHRTHSSWLHPLLTCFMLEAIRASHRSLDCLEMSGPTSVLGSCPALICRQKGWGCLLQGWDIIFSLLLLLQSGWQGRGQVQVSSGLPMQCLIYMQLKIIKTSTRSSFEYTKSAPKCPTKHAV